MCSTGAAGGAVDMDVDAEQAVPVKVFMVS